VLSAQGTQASAFYLQYRDDGGVPRWMFALPRTDTATFVDDEASGGAPDTHTWHQIVGVYDAGARQLVLYVDGNPAGITALPATATRWNATGPLNIGRAQFAGASGNYFNGAIDDVHVYTGAMTVAQVRAAYSPEPSATPPVTVYSGELTRWVGDSGLNLSSSTGVVPGDYHFALPMGWFAPASASGTQTLYSCQRSGWGQFSSISATCEGYQLLGTLGSVYTDASQGQNLLQVFRCSTVDPSTATGVYFDSFSSTCEGFHVIGPLGYLRPYAPLVRYLDTDVPDHWTSSHGIGLAADYRPEADFGVISMAGTAGTTPLYMCESGTDEYVSTDATCGGNKVLNQTGYIWTSPPSGVKTSTQLYECATTGAGERFESESANCEGQRVVGSLGWIVTGL
jgi:hypothetical protein